MTFDEFIQKWSGKPIDFDGIYPNQCMDLMHFYIYKVLNIKDKTVCATPSAYQVFTNFKWENYFEKITNTPERVPVKGDIVVFGTAIGQYGHVCIFVDGDVNSFTSFDANWPTGTLPHIQGHNYKGVLGWLHFKVEESSNEDEIIKLNKEISKLKKANNILHQDLTDKEKEIKRLINQEFSLRESVNFFVSSLLEELANLFKGSRDSTS